MDRSVTHATFSLERDYPVPVAKVFAAWADPAAKAQWFAGGPDGGPVMTFESSYHDVVPGERIVYSSTMAAGEDLMTISVTTVEFTSAGEGTRLLLTEQGTYLDGREEPAWREHGTAEQLDALGRELGNQAAG